MCEETFAAGLLAFIVSFFVIGCVPDKSIHAKIRSLDDRGAAQSWARAGGRESLRTDRSRSLVSLFRARLLLASGRAFSG
jgi:hypothetical protein